MNKNSASRLANVLLAEDSLADVELVQAHMDFANLKFNLSFVRDGEEAISFLKKQGDYSEVETPDLVILDLNIPKVNGKQILSYIRQDTDLQHLAVVILTGSDNINDIDITKKLGADYYLLKPLNYDKLKKVTEEIEGLYFESIDGATNLCA